MACTYYPPDNGYLQSLLGFVDCQARTIGEQGYLALAAPGSVASLALTSLLTLFVALIGYRMLLGEVPGVRGGVLALVKIGVVLALASGWPAYRTLIYDVALDAPAEIAAAIGGPAGLPGATGGLVARMDGLDRGFEALAIEGPGPAPDPTVQLVAPPMFGGFDTFAIGASRTTFLIGALGSFAGLRLLAGLLLALGPLFVGFLLFDATRGLFVGWLRLLAGAALGVVATSIALGVELALLEPWLSDLLARRVAQQPIPGAPAQLLAATIVFALVLIVMIGGAARAAWALRLPTTAPVLLRERFERRDSSERSSIDRRNAPAAIDGRSRASVIVDAVTAAQRREATATGVAGHSAGAGSASSASITIRQSMNNTGGSVSPQGAPSRRRASVRGSASARRRDFNA